MVHINEASSFCFASTYYWRPRNKGQKETRGPCHPPVCCHGYWLKQKCGSAVEETLNEETAAVKCPALSFLVFVCPCLPSQTCLSRAPRERWAWRLYDSFMECQWRSMKWYVAAVAARLHSLTALLQLQINLWDVNKHPVPHLTSTHSQHYCCYTV